MGTGLDSQVLIAAISMIGGVITTWIISKYKHQVNRKKEPKDRMETAIEWYEKFIVEQRQENDRKSKVIEHLENIVDKLEEELTSTKELLSSTKQELDQSIRNNALLEEQLKSMRVDYRTTK